VAARFSSEGGAFVTVQDTGGDFGLSGRDATRAFLGGVSALARTAALEWPAAAVKAIDIDRASRDAGALAQAILAELLQGGTTLEVGLHADGRRTTLVSELTPSPSPLAVANINAQSVVIASGGGRGVTAAALVALAKARQPRMALLGRTPMGEEPAELRAFADAAALKGGLLALAKASGRKITPAQLNAEIASYLALREIRATLAALQAAGSEARYIAVDVADAAALTSALQSVRSQWGPITAVVHGAGVLADKRIEDKSDAQFDRVFDTKVLGLRALLAATANDPLSALCLFSSVAARTGNLGQCDYAMANEVLNLVACAERRRRGASCTVRAIGWGPWEGGMVTPGLKAHFEQMGVALIPLATGARRFVEEMTGGGDDVSVVIGGAQGDGALGAAVTPKATLELRVDQHSHPFLADHCIGGVPVVPVVLVLEWFMRAASACCPGKVLAAVEQVKVMRGLKLDGFAAGGDRFTVTARQVSNGSGAQVAVELRGKGQALHYSATVTLSDSAAEQPTLLERPALKKWTRPEFYDGHVLFHGASLQVIQSVKGVSPEGIVGTLSGIESAPNKKAWSGKAWRSDVAAMDGGLQLAVLWAEHVLGGAALPMAIGEYRSYCDGPGPGALECVVHARKVHAAGSVCDIAFIDSSGQVVAEMIGVETVLRPDAAPAASALA
jgi:hypothetical protein